MGYVSRMLRAFLGQEHTWEKPQNFAAGVTGALGAGSGKSFYVDPTSGSVGAPATSWETAEASILGAYNRCVDGRGDTIYVQSRGSTSAATTSYLETALTWSKSGITVIGIGAPTLSQRPRVANLSTSLDLATLITVSGANNSFYNMQFLNGGSDAAALAAVTVTGERNYFENCHIIGGLHATPGAVVTCCSLFCNGAAECRFVGCTFGTDTIINAAANAPVRFDSTCYRLEFLDCRIISWSDTAGHGGMKFQDASAIGRDLLVKNCVFSNFSANSPSALTVVLIGTAPTSGVVMIANCQAFGWAAWAAANDAYFIANGAADNDAAGIGVVQA